MLKENSRRKIKAFKCAVFKVETTKRKENIINTQMRLSETAYYKSLSAMSFHVDVMLKLDKKARKQALAEIKKQVAVIVKPLPLSNAAKSVVKESVTAQISSPNELTLTDQNANLPSIGDRNSNNYLKGMSLLLSSTTKADEDIAKDLIYTKPYDGMPLPITWLRTRVSDGALILKDDLNRFFVYLNTHSSKSKFSDKNNKTIIENLVNVRTGEIVSFASTTGILLPLVLSDWHKKEYIEKANAKSYTLIKSESGYRLAVAFEFEVDAIETNTLLGVDRGIDAIAAYAVTNGREVLESDIFSGVQLKEYQRAHEKKHKIKQKMGKSAKDKWAGYADNIVHIIANKIVETAIRNKSQVVLEDLKNISNGHHKKRAKFTRKTNFSRMLSRAQYQKLSQVLEYKLQCAGLPKPREVHAAGTSITCNKCGNYDKENRQSQAEFKCTKCSHSDNADTHASSNIAMKLDWLQTDYNKSKKKMKRTFSEYLANT